jgi:hypothetical protein
VDQKVTPNARGGREKLLALLLPGKILKAESGIRTRKTRLIQIPLIVQWVLDEPGFFIFYRAA